MAKMLTIKEVAERLDVSVFTVRRLIQRGQLPAAKIGNQWRVEQDALELYIKSRSGFVGDPTISKLYFRAEVLSQFFDNPRYYVQEEGSRGRLGLKQDWRAVQAYKSTKYLLDDEKKNKPVDPFEAGFLPQLYFWKVKLKNGNMAVMVQPKEFYRMQESEQKKWLPYAIENPAI